MGYRSSVTIREGGGWSLTSYGGGAAFLLHGPDDWALFAQGDDAEALESDLHALDAAYPDDGQDLILARLAEPYR